jgi:hypothetical protein
MERTLQFPIPSPDWLKAPHFYLWKMKETATIKQVGHFKFKGDTIAETHLLFGTPTRLYRLIIPYDLVAAGLRIPKVTAPFKGQKRSIIKRFVCDITMTQLFNAEQNAAGLMQLLGLLSKLRFLNAEERTNALETFFNTLKLDCNLSESLTQTNFKHYLKHQYGLKCIRRADRKYNLLIRKLETDGAVQLPDGNYLVLVKNRVNNGFECFHVLKNGREIRQLTAYGLPFQMTVLRLVRRGGYPKHSAKLQSSVWINEIVQRLGKVNAALALILLPTPKSR